MLLIRKPSISMGHLYHGYVSLPEGNQLFITPITMVYGIVTGAYKPTNITGGPSINQLF